MEGRRWSDLNANNVLDCDDFASQMKRSLCDESSKVRLICTSGQHRIDVEVSILPQCRLYEMEKVTKSGALVGSLIIGYCGCAQ